MLNERSIAVSSNGFHFSIPRRIPTLIAAKRGLTPSLQPCNPAILPIKRSALSKCPRTDLLLWRAGDAVKFNLIDKVEEASERPDRRDQKREPGGRVSGRSFSHVSGAARRADGRGGGAGFGLAAAPSQSFQPVDGRAEAKQKREVRAVRRAGELFCESRWIT